MTAHTNFTYRSSDEIRNHAEEQNLNLPWSDDFSVFCLPLSIGEKNLVNRFAVLPIDGCDATSDGEPGELTFRRYVRYGGGGAGIIHFGPVATCTEARANKSQLVLSDVTASCFESLLQQTRTEALAAVGIRPLCYIQLNESGRFSCAAGITPSLAYRNPTVDLRLCIPRETPVLSDNELEGILNRYVHAAVLAYHVGFDGIDIAACDGCLLYELLGARMRIGRYGGAFEKRVRMILDALKGIRELIPDPEFQIVSRLNIYDAEPSPFGWGVSESDVGVPDLTEPIELAKLMMDCGVEYIAATCGTSYNSEWISRPSDRYLSAATKETEHPLEGICRGIRLTSQIQNTYRNLPVACFGLSWLRNYLPNVAAGIICDGHASIIGLGRVSMAYPELPRDIMDGNFSKQNNCITCGLCYQAMLEGGPVGCYAKDKKIYVL